jgi:hypothetical protein
MPFAVSGKDREGRSGIFRKPKNFSKEENSIKNIFKNAILPLNGGKLMKGTAVYILLEVAVSKILRRIMGGHNKTIPELFMLHLLSLGIMGGVSASMTSPGEFIVPYGNKKIKQHAKQGMKGVLPLYIAQYIQNTFFSGFYMGGISLREAAITAAAKILTRPIASKIYPKGKFFQNAFEAQQLMEEMQMQGSNFARIPASDLYPGKDDDDDL